MAVLARCSAGSHCRGLVLVLGPFWLAAIQGCQAQVPAPAAPAAADKEPEGCRVSGRIVSTAWRNLGGGIERAIVSAWSLPDTEQETELEQVAYFSGEGEPFEVRLPPGKYRLICSAVGTRGATFEILSRETTIAEGQESVDVGQVDLPISESTALFGKPAPELNGIVGWRDTPAIAIKDLKGKVVVLDFFAYTCSICHTHKPDLVKLREKYERKGLVVLAIHDDSLETLAEMNEKMEPILRRVFDGDPPRLPMALDGPGEQSVFKAYGIYAVPAVILIDQQGRIVRRYHHAGKPELEADVRDLLSGIFNRVQ